MSRRRERKRAHVPDKQLIRRKTTVLEDGTTGYGMLPTRWDDCFRAAIATTLQIAPVDIPDPHIDQRLRHGHDPESIRSHAWAQLLAWLAGRGLCLRHHANVPVAHERWIGVCPAPATADEISAIVDRVVAGESRASRRGPVPRSGVDGLRNRLYFNDHCLVMSHRRVLFDPAVGLAPQRGYTVFPWRAEHVGYGYSFHPEGER
jgi:hypothetical protein